MLVDLLRKKKRINRGNAREFLELLSGIERGKEEIELPKLKEVVESILCNFEEQIMPNVSGKKAKEVMKSCFNLNEILAKKGKKEESLEKWLLEMDAKIATYESLLNNKKNPEIQALMALLSSTKKENVKVD